ncbi:Lrp/AsnC family transcriptional regulator of ectoine degradation [Donghicola tyrosinivorans]|uniref:Lrp/AsnC family transcriptional regulator of ectoine degradation n=2 Tax=Donghicola tyrosinivorans TaxID=1652492 RepID=A0A2T0WC65_9RHOB|nr:Lrp/AsnC family transcriptional regulator of ectoine degradation [Donghicola tyrosinivorans]
MATVRRIWCCRVCYKPMQRLDARDLAILRTLCTEGRISKTDLAARVGLSPTPCWERLAKLERAGVIQGYGAQVALRAIGPHVVIFATVELDGHRAEDFRRFEAAMQRLPEVTGVWALGGGFDYLVQVITRDIDSYQRMIDGLLEEEIGLARYYTYIVTKSVKSAPPPLDFLAGL